MPRKLTSRRILCVAAILCMLSACLPSAACAVAAPTATPTPLMEEGQESTPAPADITLPDGGGGSAGTGGGQGKQPDAPPQPPQPPQPPIPPQSGTKPEKPDNTPVEVDPNDVPQPPFRPKKEKIKKLVGTYTITAKVKTLIAQGNILQYYWTADFRATKQDGDMMGEYTVKGTLRTDTDTAHYFAVQRDGYLVTIEYQHEGPLTGTVTLAAYQDPPEKPGPLNPDLDEDVLAPLIRPRAQGNGTVRWNPGVIANNVIDHEGLKVGWPNWTPEDMQTKIEVYPNGYASVVLYVIYGGPTPLHLQGRFVKSVKWVDEQ